MTSRSSSRIGPIGDSSARWWSALRASATSTVRRQNGLDAAAWERLARERGVDVRLVWRNAVGGHGRAAEEFRRYLRDLERQGGRPPALIVVATDANCTGADARAEEFAAAAPARIVHAIPDPHIERWLLLDGAAFKSVFDRGRQAPDLKCERGRYKRLLAESIRAAGVDPSLGGMEFAEDIVRAIDLSRAARADRSFARFVDALDAVFREWRRR